MDRHKSALIGAIMLLGCDKKGPLNISATPLCHWEEKGSDTLYETVLWYVADDTGRIEGEVSKAILSKEWGVFVRGRNYGPMVSLITAKAQTEKYAAEMKICATK